MLEVASFLVSAVILGWLVRPLLRGLPLPAWFERARRRGRPGIPVTTWLGAVLLMLLVWLIGDQRGIPAFLLWLTWIMAPLVAAMVTWQWKGARRRAQGER